jgi:UDP-2-acetamido-3-amino-2,3-dideoxy-glucuronate N-acetyltransferase
MPADGPIRYAAGVIDASARIHPTADLEPDVVVGSGTSIWHRAQLRVGASIGADCVIGRDVFIDEGVSIGDRVKIQNGALIYHGVTVEDGVFVGPGAILTNDRYPRAITSSGDLATADHWTVRPIVLHHGSSIGAGAVVVAGVDVHAFATVGAGAVVTRSVPAHALVVGNPAGRIGWVCACGMRLKTLDGMPSGPMPGTPLAELRCSTCGRAYAFHAAEERLEEHPSPSRVEST